MIKPEDFLINSGSVRCQPHNKQAVYVCTAKNCSEDRILCQICLQVHPRTHSDDLEEINKIVNANKCQEIENSVAKLLTLYTEQQEKVQKRYHEQLEGIWDGILPIEEMLVDQFKKSEKSFEQKLLEEQNRALQQLESVWSLLNEKDAKISRDLLQQYLESYQALISANEKLTQYLTNSRKLEWTSQNNQAASNELEGNNLERLEALINLKVEDFIEDFLEAMESRNQKNSVHDDAPPTSKPRKTPSTRPGTDLRTARKKEANDEEAQMRASIRKNKKLKRLRRNRKDEEDSAPSIISNHSYDIVRELEAEWRLFDGSPKTSAYKSELKKSEALSIKSFGNNHGMDPEDNDEDGGNENEREDDEDDDRDYDMFEESKRAAPRVVRIPGRRGRPRKIGNESLSKNRHQSNAFHCFFDSPIT